jgi:hypothetical protein
LVVIGLAACNAILGNDASITYVDGDALAPGDRRDGEDAFADAADASERDASAPDPDVPCDAAAFCSDFDPPFASIPFGWAEARPNDAAVFPTDNTDFVTAPNALALSLQTGETGRWLATEIDGGRPFAFIFDVFVRAVGSGSIELLQIACRSPGTIRLLIDENGTLSLQVDTQTTAGPGIVPVRQWMRLALVVSESQTILDVLGPQQASLEVARSCQGPFTTSLGILVHSGLASSLPWTVLFDRVRATVP